MSQDRVAPRRVSNPRWRTPAPLAVGLILAVGLLLLIIQGKPGAQARPAEELRRLAGVAIQKSDWERAEAWLAGIPHPTPRDWLDRARTAVSRKAYDEALGFLDRVAAEPALRADVLLIRGQVALKRDEARAAEEHLVAALRDDPGLAPARRLLIYLYGTQERRAAMLEQFAALAEHGPLTLDLMQDWCLTRAGLGDLSQGIKDLERFVERDPEDRNSRLALASMSRQSGDFDRAEAVLTPMAPTDPDAIVERALVLLDRGRPDEAEALIATGPPESPRVARLRGRLALSRKDPVTAAKFFRASDRAEPNNRETWIGLANALRLTGDPEAAAVTAKSRAYDQLRAKLQQVRERRIASKEAVVEMAGLCETAGLNDEARAWYRLLLTLEPLNAEAQAAIYRLTPARKSQAGAGR